MVCRPFDLRRMKAKIICLWLPLLLVGCSKKSPPAASPPAASAPLTQFVEVIPDEVQEQDQIKAKALALLNDRDFDGLEALAARYRDSKEKYADGKWKLSYVYTGLEPSGSDPEPVWQERQKQIRSWIRDKPGSVTARVAMGAVLVDYAWQARGSGWAGSVSDEGWRSMSERLQEAAQILGETRGLQEKCPVYWSTLQRVAAGLQLDKTHYTALFEKTVKAYPDYENYFNLRAYYLLPRWYGGPGELERDLEQSADRIGGDEGDMVYAQVVWNVHEYGTTTNVFAENQFSWPRTSRGFDAILKNFPDSPAAMNEGAHLAALAGDPQKARELFLLTQGRMDTSLWDDTNQFMDSYKWATGQ